MQKIKQQLIKALSQVIILLTKQVEHLQIQLNFKRTTDKNGYVHLVARNMLGKEFGKTDKELRCAETINNLFLLITGKTIGGGTSTLRMYNKIRLDKRFKEVSKPKDGYLILSPTGFGNGRIEHGHVGVISGDRVISNNSLTGKLDNHLSLAYWNSYYGFKGSFPVKFYMLV